MEKLIHLLLPRESNNHKAKILHSSSLLVLGCLLIIFQAVIEILPNFGSNILGYAAQISPEEVMRLTNQKRSEAGLSALSYNPALSSAAYTKGRDMLEKDYWAHVAPDGTQPWKFFSDFGYRYRYAGENLARDFTNPSSAVDAWINSPTHRDNILNSKYQEIGIGVVEGDLAGVDTTIIVQFFGTSYQDRVQQPLAKAEKTLTPPSQTASAVPATPQAVIEVLPTQVPTQILQASNQPPKVLVSPFTTTKAVSLAVVGLLFMVFVVDALIVSRRKIARIGGRTLAHLSFLGMILFIVFILKSGKIL